VSDTITMTPDNAEEFLDAAAAASHEADGTTPETPETPDPATPDVDESEAPPATEPEDKKVEGLEIEEKADESDDSDDSDTPSFDMEEVFAEWAENGSIAPETNDAIVKALTGAGFGDQAQAIIDQYISGADASVQSIRGQAFEVVGGETQYASMMEWAQGNLKPAEVEAFNQAVADPAMVPLAVRGLHAQYTAATGAGAPQAPAPPARVAAGANVQAGVAPVNSLQQVAEITADPRYDADPGWRASQDARIKASMDAGILK
jgi:hypothetical protein